MSYVRKNKKNVLGSIVGVMVITGLAIWQFYQFVTFKGVNGVAEMQGGSIHLWLAIAMGLFACISGFLVFSVFLRHDNDDELHITAPPSPRST